MIRNVLPPFMVHSVHGLICECLVFTV